MIKFTIKFILKKIICKKCIEEMTSVINESLGNGVRSDSESLTQHKVFFWVKIEMKLIFGYSWENFWFKNQ